jgi:hypothetical protein
MIYISKDNPKDEAIGGNNQQEGEIDEDRLTI